MEIAEAAALIAVAGGFDNRKPDRDASIVWAEALRGVDFTDAKEAVMNHYRAESRWIMPADVIKGVRAIEASRIAAAPSLDDLVPPTRVTALEGEQFDTAYLAWRKEQAHRIRRGLPLDVGHAPLSVPEERVRELVGALSASLKAS